MDLGYIQYFAERGRTSVSAWAIAGKVTWVLTGIGVLIFVIGDATHRW